MSTVHSTEKIPAVDLDSSKIRRGLTPAMASVDDALMRAEISWAEIGLLCGMARNRRRTENESMPSIPCSRYHVPDVKQLDFPVSLCQNPALRAVRVHRG